MRSRAASRETATRETLFDDVAWFVVSMVAILVYFMCALADAPFWAYGWLVVIVVIYSVKVVRDV